MSGNRIAKEIAEKLAATSNVPEKAGLIIGKSLKGKSPFGLSSAFEQINEPLEKLNEPRNKAIEIVAHALGKQLDISGGKVPSMAADNADILQQAAQFAIPSSQDFVAGPIGKVLKAGKSAKLAQQARQQVNLQASEMAREAAAKLKQAMATGYKPTAAEGIALSKFEGVQTAIPTAQEAAGIKARLEMKKPEIRDVADQFHKPTTPLTIENGVPVRKLPFGGGSGI